MYFCGIPSLGRSLKRNASGTNCESFVPQLASFGSVCQDFRVREDGALATRLQEEEFQKHYGMNRNERKSVRGDLCVAKKTYLEEVRTAALLPEEELAQMEETDKWLAKELQDRLQAEECRELRTRSELEARDAQIAKDLQERERQKLEHAQQRKRELEIQAEQETRHLLAAHKQDRGIEPHQDESTRNRADRERARDRADHWDTRSNGRAPREERPRGYRERVGAGSPEAQRRRDPDWPREDRPRDPRDYVDPRDRDLERTRDHRDRDFERSRHDRRERDREVERARDQKDVRARDRDPERSRDYRDGRPRNRSPERQRDQRDARPRDQREREADRSRDGRPRESRDAERPRDCRPRETDRDPRDKERRERRDNSRENQVRRDNDERDHPQDRIRGRREEKPKPIDPNRGPDMDREPQRPRESRPRERADRCAGPPAHDKRVRSKELDQSEERAENGTERQRGRREQRREANLKGNQWDPKWERNRAVNGNADSMGRHSNSSSTGSEEESSRKLTGLGEGVVVALPENGGGRLEPDRIIMADGTAIDLFDDEEERQKALKREREKKDEELAKMLQEQERRLVEHERMAAQDKKIAVEGQDRELARELQKKEYERAQAMAREMRRSNSAPGERRRLPSYGEAVHRRQMPDLLQDQDLVLEIDPLQIRPDSLTRTTHSSGDSSQGSHPSSLERGLQVSMEGQTVIPGDKGPSPITSLERSNEQSASSRDSFASSGQGSFDRAHVSPTSRAEVWERLYEAGADPEFDHNTKHNRPVARSRTVGTSNPSDNELATRLPYNVVEGIDPTFKRAPKSPGKDDGEEEKAKVIPLIKPHRRRSGDRKKNRENSENCKQQ
ncbi:trichohyalin isoform X2 [Nematostella vectensis]|uniref:trichohyalin isoform X2 n=1 Tax=Nematostella vectensis TaxID=45351 RepID=UPI0020776CCB|nr:trichohyalin isoform X2 [Nematostella vectensis]